MNRFFLFCIAQTTQNEPKERGNINPKKSESEYKKKYFFSLLTWKTFDNNRRQIKNMSYINLHVEYPCVVGDWSKSKKKINVEKSNLFQYYIQYEHNTWPHNMSSSYTQVTLYSSLTCSLKICVWYILCTK